MRTQGLAVGMVAITCFALGGYAIWFALGPAANNHSGMPFLAWGVVLWALGFILAMLASRISRSSQRE